LSPPPYIPGPVKRGGAPKEKKKKRTSEKMALRPFITLFVVTAFQFFSRYLQILVKVSRSRLFLSSVNFCNLAGFTIDARGLGDFSSEILNILP
jgi:hypothetical protein